MFAHLRPLSEALVSREVAKDENDFSAQRYQSEERHKQIPPPSLYIQHCAAKVVKDWETKDKKEKTGHFSQMDKKTKL